MSTPDPTMRSTPMTEDSERRSLEGLQESPEAGRRVVERTGITYDVARDPSGSLFQSFGATAMPTTVLIDANG